MPTTASSQREPAEDAQQPRAHPRGVQRRADGLGHGLRMWGQAGWVRALDLAAEAAASEAGGTEARTYSVMPVS